MTTPIDMFCVGHMLLSNGVGLAAGGTSGYKPWRGAKALYTFDFASETFVRQTDMQHGRWYPTVIGTPTGDAAIVGGYNHDGLNAGYHEFWTTGTNAVSNLPGKRVFPLIRTFLSSITAITSSMVRPTGRASTAGRSIPPVSGIHLPMLSVPSPACSTPTAATVPGHVLSVMPDGKR